MKRFLPYLLFGILAVFLVSCVTGVVMSRKDSLTRPSEGKAIVNFMTPFWGGLAKPVMATIWDGDKLIGVSRGKLAFQYECDPGKHLFISWSEFKSPVEAELLPNRMYYIVLRTRMGGFRARIHQVPVNKDHPLWEKALAWHKALPNFVFDQEAFQKLEAEGKQNILVYLEKYDHEIKGTKYVQYLRPDDGVPPQQQ